MVFGVVHQSGGAVRLRSELGTPIAIACILIRDGHESDN
jgi:hypothetical protein